MVNTLRHSAAAINNALQRHNVYWLNLLTGTQEQVTEAKMDRSVAGRTLQLKVAGQWFAVTDPRDVITTQSRKLRRG
jgi:hypothetical protein